MLFINFIKNISFLPISFHLLYHEFNSLSIKETDYRDGDSGDHAVFRDQCAPQYQN